LCKLFGKSRQAYYQGFTRELKKKEVQQQIVSKVKRIRKKHRHMGGKKVYEKLSEEFKQEGIQCGRDKLFDILREENMLIKYKKHFVKTTQSKHLFYKYPNLVQDVFITRSEQVWVSDITYLRTKQGFVYLFLITDAYSKQIMGWELSDNMKTVNAIKALQMAIKNRKYPDRELIHHSDRGLQYCNPSYVEVLEGNNLKISMTTKYDPYENAIAERVNGILKTEYEIGEGFLGYKDAKKEVKYAILLYNTDRPHLSCKMMAPARAHEKENFDLRRWSKKFCTEGYPSVQNKTISLNTKLIT
jgi:transposase InsO family protein